MLDQEWLTGFEMSKKIVPLKCLKWCGNENYVFLETIRKSIESLLKALSNDCLVIDQWSVLEIPKKWSLNENFIFFVQP